MSRTSAYLQLVYIRYVDPNAPINSMYKLFSLASNNYHKKKSKIDSYAILVCCWKT